MKVIKQDMTIKKNGSRSYETCQKPELYAAAAL